VYEYLDESQLALISRLTRISILALLAVMVISGVQPATSQLIGTLDPGFGQAIAALHKAETTGATPSEVSGLVSLLNRALELNREAQTMNAPDQTGKRAALLAQVDQILASVDNQSAQLATASSQEVYINRILTYALGGIVAVLGTALFVFASSLYQKYRIKRTFQMSVTKK
jgi:hypothetical protein